MIVMMRGWYYDALLCCVGFIEMYNTGRYIYMCSVVDIKDL